MRRRALWFLLVPQLVATLQLRSAEARTPAELKQSLLALGENPNRRAAVSVCERRCGGQTRVILNPRGDAQLQALSRVLDRNSNVLEICHCGYDTFTDGGRQNSTNHSFSIFNRQAPHVNVYNGWTDWKLNDLGMGNLRPSTRRVFSAMIQLTPNEARRFQQSIDLCYALQRLDPMGYLKASEDRVGRVRQSNPGLFQDPLVLENVHRVGRWNCASFYTEMKLGDRGEQLWQLLGLDNSYSGNPRGLQQALETRANDRVVGLAVYHGDLPKGPNGSVFYFEPGSTQ